nr:TcR V13J2.6 beta chain {clone Mouse3A6, complementarity determining region 3} [mice, CBA/J, induced autoimmune thyroiditic, thyroid, Peptide Partial, 15 aa] [Mus sp.]
CASSPDWEIYEQYFG